MSVSASSGTSMPVPGGVMPTPVHYVNHDPVMEGSVRRVLNAAAEEIDRAAGRFGIAGSRLKSDYAEQFRDAAKHLAEGARLVGVTSSGDSSLDPTNVEQVLGDVNRWRDCAIERIDWANRQGGYLVDREHPERDRDAIQRVAQKVRDLSSAGGELALLDEAEKLKPTAVAVPEPAVVARRRAALLQSAKIAALGGGGALAVEALLHLPFF